MNPTMKAFIKQNKTEIDRGIILNSLDNDPTLNDQERAYHVENDSVWNQRARAAGVPGLGKE